jgi:transposase
MPIEKFIALYEAAVADDMLREDFAKKIGVNAETVYQRVAELRKDGLDLVHLRTGGRLTVIERARIALAKARGTDTPAPKASPLKKAKAQVVVETPKVEVTAESDELERLLSG